MSNQEGLDAGAPDFIEDRLPEVEKRASEILINYDEAKGWFPAPLEGDIENDAEGLYEFVIVTTDELVDAVQPLVNWEKCKGKTIEGSGADVAFNPPDSGPHPYPYRIEIKVTSSVSGLSNTEVIDITVHLAGDANGSGRVDILDKRVVRDQYGMSGCACP